MTTNAEPARAQRSIDASGPAPAAAASTGEVDLTVVIPALNDDPNLEMLLPQLQDLLRALGIRHDILIVTRHADEATRRLAAARVGVSVIEQTRRGYGGALLAGFGRSTGRYVLTVDADTSQRPEFVADLWARRDEADVMIASRYVPGGQAVMPVLRRTLSGVLNWFFRLGLNVPIRDLSSGFRLYRGSVIREQIYTARDFDILQQIIVKVYAEGWKVAEVPFVYRPLGHGSSNARVFRIGRAYLATFGQLWRLRNSILAADYDDRAHDSRIFLQRYWQRSRFRHVTDLIEGEGRVLDVGCGSSRIIGSLPRGSVAVDVLQRKLRYARKFNRWLVRASGFSLPFPDRSFSCVLCSQVIEHVPKASPIIGELLRVLAPGGRLVLGTPDYDHWEWVVMEKAYRMAAPGGYADEHIAHYTFDELKNRLEREGLVLEAFRYILRGELIMAFRRPASPTASPALNA